MNKKIRSFLICVFVACIFPFLGTPGASGENDIIPPKIKNTPLLDGKIDEKVWTEAYHIKNFQNPHTPVPADTPTEVFLCYDDSCLYFAVKCYEPNVKELKKSNFTSARDNTVYADDCIQIFLDVNHDHFSCFQFNINPIGTQEDFLCNSSDWKLPFKEWDGIWHSASYIGEDYWSTEFAIPFYTLNLSPQDIDVIGINFARTKKVFPSENSCWACTYGGFHNYSKYGHLRNLKINNPKVLIRDIDWRKNKWGENNVHFNAANTENKTWIGSLVLYLKDINDKNLYEFSEDMELRPNETRRISFPYICRNPGKYIAVLGIKEKTDKMFKPLFSNPCIIPPSLEVSIADMLVYENENIHIPMQLNTIAVNGYEVIIRIAKGNEIQKEVLIKPDGLKINAVILTKGLPEGEYLVNIELRYNKESITAQKRKLEIIKSF